MCSSVAPAWTGQIVADDHRDPGQIVADDHRDPGVPARLASGENLPDDAGTNATTWPVRRFAAPWLGRGREAPMDAIQLGPVTISRVVEIGRSSFPTAMMLPGSDPGKIAAHLAWIRPHFFDETTGDIGSRIQTWVVRTPRHTILIDTGVGNDKQRAENPTWHLRHGTFLDDLKAAGVTPEGVDYVLCTHMHIDHVGWNTRLQGGTWVPTFPRAKYVFVGEEWEFWRHEAETGKEPYGCIDDSVFPIVNAGQAIIVDVDEYLSFEPSRGHTPGHASIRLKTPAGEAVF